MRDINNILFCPVWNTDPYTELGNGPLVWLTNIYKPEKVYLFYTREMYDREASEGDIFREAVARNSPDSKVIKLTDHIVEDPCDQQNLFNLFNSLLKTIIDENPGKKVHINVTSGTIEMRLALILISSILKETILDQATEHNGKFFVKPLDNRTIDAYNAEFMLSSLIDAYDYFGAYQMVKNDSEKLLQEHTSNLVTHAYYRYFEKKDNAKAVLPLTELDTQITTEIPNIRIYNNAALSSTIQGVIENYQIIKYKSKVNDLKSLIIDGKNLGEFLALIYMDINGFDYMAFSERGRNTPRKVKYRKTPGFEQLHKMICSRMGYDFKDGYYDLNSLTGVVKFLEAVAETPENKRLWKAFDTLYDITSERNNVAHIEGIGSLGNAAPRYQGIITQLEKILKAISGVTHFELFDDLNRMIKGSFFCYTYEKAVLPAPEAVIKAEETIKDEVNTDPIDDDDIYFDDTDTLTDDEEYEYVYDDDYEVLDTDDLLEMTETETLSRVPVNITVQTYIDESIKSALINYTSLFGNDDRTDFRWEIINQVFETLITKNKPNPLLIGPAGVGKTRLVEDIAYLLNNHKCFYHKALNHVWVYELKLSNLISGTGVQGDLEEKLNLLIEFLSANKDNVIVFIDEIHMLMQSSNDMKCISQVLKPALARGAIRCIGATTLQESNQLTSDPAFSRRFSRIIVNEPTAEETVVILKNALPEFARHHSIDLANLIIDDNVLRMTVETADRFTSAGSHRPDNALTLLDLTLSKAMSKRQKASDELPLITNEFLRTTAKQIISGNEHQAAIDYDALVKRLSVIKGQAEVVNEIIEIIKFDEMGYFPRKKPLTMLFTGSSGVGKTEVTKIIAEYVTCKRPIILNMAEYEEYSSVNRIIGVNLGYKDSDSNAELVFDSLESNPYQFILLDEFEKCHKKVQRLFLSIFDEGILVTSKGKTLDFSQSIIIATTNAANDIANRAVGFTEDTSSSSKDKVKKLGKNFDPELVARFDHIINFNVLSKKDYIEIVESIYESEAERFSKTADFKLPEKMDEKTLEKIRKDYVAESGARQAKRKVNEYIKELIKEAVKD